MLYIAALVNLKNDKPAVSLIVVKVALYLPIVNQALLATPLFFQAMLILKDQTKKKDTGKSQPDLTTEGPLSEKDEQAIAIERTKKLQQEAQENWKHNKKKGS